MIFICEGYRPINASSMEAAAKAFAGREARRRFGRAGECVSLLRSSAGVYQASIGIRERNRGNGPSWRDCVRVWLYIATKGVST